MTQPHPELSKGWSDQDLGTPNWIRDIRRKLVKEKNSDGKSSYGN